MKPKCMYHGGQQHDAAMGARLAGKIKCILETKCIMGRRVLTKGRSGKVPGVENRAKEQNKKHHEGQQQNVGLHNPL